MITFLVILYIGLAIMNSIVIDKNNTDGEDIDRSKGFLKPYTFTFLSVVITILFFMDSNLIMGILFLLNVFSDIKNKA
jgi:hypothetical protein